MKEISKREFSKSIVAVAVVGSSGVTALGNTLAIASPEPMAVVEFSGARIASVEIPLEPKRTFADRLFEAKLDLELTAGIDNDKDTIMELTVDAYRFMRKTQQISLTCLEYGKCDRTAVHWRGYSVSVKNSALEISTPYNIPATYKW